MKQTNTWGKLSLSSKNMEQLVTGCSFKKEKMEILMCNLQKVPIVLKYIIHDLIHQDLKRIFTVYIYILMEI